MSDIKIQVKTRYLPDHLPEDDPRFAFAYQIRIENAGEEAVTLYHRHWLITDGNGKKIEVSGEGVVGKKPDIAPGEAFQYTSAALIDTPVGFMEGFYELYDAAGESFQASIPGFSLTVPGAVH